MLDSATDADPQVPVVSDAIVADNPTAPRGASDEALAFTSAPLMSGVRVSADRDSIIIHVPAVPGASDYRVFALSPGLTLAAQQSGETVQNTDIFCAGPQQFNAPAPAQPVVMQQIEILHVTAATRVVVEALDTPCPFTGVRGAAAYQTTVTSSEVPAADRVAFAIYTEADIRKTYGATIFNGHKPGTRLAAPAAPNAPKVLARTTITVTPRGTDTPPLAYFDDFSANDQPVQVLDLPTFSDRSSNGKVLQNHRWSFYAYNYDHVDFLIDRGQLQTTTLDRYQGVFATSYVVPRRPVALADDTYLHVTFTVNSDASQRRYWWMFLCGAETPGATLTSDGLIKGNIVNTAFFYQPDGRNPSIENWNCFHLFPRDGSPFGLPPSKQRPQSDLRVMVNQANRPYRDNVVNVSPDQYAQATGSASASPGWFRQIDSQGNLVKPMLDDQLNIGLRTHYDMYIKRDRVVLYVNGEQRLCNDFPATPLTMAEGALGFGQVLYHSTAERLEFSRGFDDRTGQRYYLTNTPYADVRSWDNLGYQEKTRAPTTFDSSLCYVAK